MHGDLRKGKRGIHGVIEFGEAQRITWFLNVRAQQPAGIENEPNGLAAFHLENARDQAMAARGGCPADVADFVA